MPERVAVFIDAQNTYKGARDAFWRRPGNHIQGQFNPFALANHIVSSGQPGIPRVLQECRIYTGRPDSNKDFKSYSAHMKQCANWRAQGATVIPRTLRYPRNWPRVKAEEKGIDVKMALDIVTMAIDDHYDVGVVVSSDTDLRPAIEYVLNSSRLSKKIEVAAWRSDSRRTRLSLKGVRIWCHWLDRSTYDRLADNTDYAR